MTRLNIIAYGTKLIHIDAAEMTLAQMAECLAVPVHRLHKSKEINYYIHDITHEEEERIQNMTAGYAKGILRK